MKLIHRLFRPVFSEESIVVIFSTLLISASIYSAINFYLSSPPGTVYTFIHNSTSDYPYYISFIRQGVEGRWTTIDQFTTEEQNSSFIHIFYLFLGRIGGVFGLSPIFIYFLARVILGLIFLFVGYIFISLYLKSSKSRLLAFIFFTTSISFPKIMQVDGRNILVPYLWWWTEVDPLRRATFIPHFMMGHIGLVSISIFLIYIFTSLLRKTLVKKKIEMFAVAAMLGLVVGFAHPPSLGMIYYIFTAFYLILYISILLKRKDYFLKKRINKSLILFIFFIIFTVPSLIYIYYTTANIFPWILMKAQESRFYSISLTEYLLAIGPILPIGILGLFVLLKEARKKYQFLIPILWVVISILMIPFSSALATTTWPIKIPTFANIRFLSMSIQLPLSISAVMFLYFIRNKFGKALFIVILFGYFGLTILMFPQSIFSQLADFRQAPNFVFLKISKELAYRYLDGQSLEDEAVLATPDNSLLLPLFAKNRVYLGQSIYTYNNTQKKEWASEFFSLAFDKCRAFKFLKQGRIGYVLTESEEFSSNIGRYPFLNEIYHRDSVWIYRVSKDFEECG